MNPPVDRAQVVYRPSFPRGELVYVVAFTPRGQIASTTRDTPRLTPTFVRLHEGYGHRVEFLSAAAVAALVSPRPPAERASALALE